MIYKRTVLGILILSFLFLLCCFTNTNVLFTTHTRFMRTETYRRLQPLIPDLGTHIPMPLRVKGKKLPFHRIYEPRYVAKYRSLSQELQTSRKTKVILLWTPWNNIRKTINYYYLRSGNKSFVRHTCPVSNCEATHDRSRINEADAILFHFLDVKAYDMPEIRTQNQVWILYDMEPPWLIKRHQSNQELDKLDYVFNLTMSYRTDSDIWAAYGLVLPPTAKDNVVSKNYSDIFANKTRSVIWFVSDCKTDSRRERYVQELKKYIDVDVYGLCGDHECFPAQSSACYDEVLTKYKFYLSFENAICKDYVTEKFFNVFNYDIIPVVFGGADYSKIAPVGSYIDSNQFPKPSSLAKLLIQIGNNETVFTDFLVRKSGFTAVLDPWMCRLCDKLHLEIQPRALKNLKEWWIDNANCRRWEESSNSFDELL